MRTRHPAKPAPAPKTAMAKRLEHVRTHKGIPSLRGFWQQLADGWDDPVSYEAVRRYHYDRDPPVAYLARIAEVCSDFRIEWLVSGTGRPTEDEELTARAVDARMNALERADFFGRAGGAFGGLDPAITLARASLEMRLSIARDRGALSYPPDGSQDDIRDSIEKVFFAPFDAWAADGRPEDVSTTLFNSYAAAALHAMSLALECMAPGLPSFAQVEGPMPDPDAETPDTSKEAEDHGEA